MTESVGRSIIGVARGSVRPSSGYFARGCGWMDGWNGRDETATTSTSQVLSFFVSFCFCLVYVKKCYTRSVIVGGHQRNSSSPLCTHHLVPSCPMPFHPSDIASDIASHLGSSDASDGIHELSSQPQLTHQYHKAECEWCDEKKRKE